MSFTMTSIADHRLRSSASFAIVGCRGTGVMFFYFIPTTMFNTHREIHTCVTGGRMATHTWHTASRNTAQKVYKSYPQGELL